MIQTLAAPCWRLVNPDGTDVDTTGDGAPHHDTEAEALNYAVDRDERPNVAPYDKPCIEVTCDECGHTFEDDAWGPCTSRTRQPRGPSSRRPTGTWSPRCCASAATCRTTTRTDQ